MFSVSNSQLENTWIRPVGPIPESEVDCAFHSADHDWAFGPYTRMPTCQIGMQNSASFGLREGAWLISTNWSYDF